MLVQVRLVSHFTFRQKMSCYALYSKSQCIFWLYDFFSNFNVTQFSSPCHRLPPPHPTIPFQQNKISLSTTKAPKPTRINHFLPTIKHPVPHIAATLSSDWSAQFDSPFTSSPFKLEPITKTRESHYYVLSRKVEIPNIETHQFKPCYVSERTVSCC